jgi:RimJ/RimL family protein N-acetyltransferase
MTARIQLRPLQVDDAETLFALVDGSRDTLSQWLPWVDNTRSAADSLAFIQRTLARR